MIDFPLFINYGGISLFYFIISLANVISYGIYAVLLVCDSLLSYDVLLSDVGLDIITGDYCEISYSNYFKFKFLYYAIYLSTSNYLFFFIYLIYSIFSRSCFYAFGSNFTKYFASFKIISCYLFSCPKHLNYFILDVTSFTYSALQHGKY